MIGTSSTHCSRAASSDLSLPNQEHSRTTQEPHKMLQRQQHSHYVSFEFIVTIAILLFTFTMAPGSTELLRKNVVHNCAVYDAHKYDEGWSVLVRISNHDPIAMWIERESEYAMLLRDKCTSFVDCGKVKIPCIHTGTGSMRAIDPVGFRKSIDGEVRLSELVSSIIINVVEIVVAMRRLALFGPMRIARTLFRVLGVLARGRKLVS